MTVCTLDILFRNRAYHSIYCTYLLHTRVSSSANQLRTILFAIRPSFPGTRNPHIPNSKPCYPATEHQSPFATTKALMTHLLPLRNPLSVTVQSLLNLQRENGFKSLHEPLTTYLKPQTLSPNLRPETLNPKPKNLKFSPSFEP